MSIASRVSALIGDIGETITYKRVTSAPALNTTTLQREPTYTDYTVKASVRNYNPKMIGAGLVDAGDKEVRIAGADLGFTPIRGDAVVIDSKTFYVKSVNTRRPRDEVSIHIMNVGGRNG